jgi:hypothetical protein
LSVFVIIDVIHLANPVLKRFTCCRWLFVSSPAVWRKNIWVCADLFSLLTFYTFGQFATR